MRILDQMRRDFAPDLRTDIRCALSCCWNLRAGQDANSVSEVWKMDEDAAVSFKTYLERLRTQFPCLDYADHSLRLIGGDFLWWKSLHSPQLHGRTNSEFICYHLDVSPNQKCRVTATIGSQERSVEIVADSLYEAGALAIEAFREADSSIRLADGVLKVAVASKTHRLRVSRLREWLTRVGGTSEEMETREKIYKRIYKQYSQSLGYENVREFRKRIDTVTCPEDVYVAIHSCLRMDKDKNYFPPRRMILQFIYAWKAVRKTLGPSR